MIGSHDSLTYLKPTSWLVGLARRWWRTQCATIDEQYKAGVRLFDLRVRWDDGKWRACHGLADLSATWKTLDDLCKWMEGFCPKALYRIVLERGAQAPFWEQGHNLCRRHQNLWRVDIKQLKQWQGTVANNNAALYKRGYRFALVNPWDSPAQELHGSLSAKNFLMADLRREARRINDRLGIFADPEALRLQAESKDTLLFIDYCTGEY